MRLLLVDDDSKLLSTLQGLLQEEGHEVEAASTAFKALEQLRHNTFDALLADVKIPRMDGIQLLETVRLSRPQMRVVLMSAYPTPETMARAKNSRVDAYLKKPFSWKELLAALGADSPTPHSD